MKLSTRTRYGARAMLELALREEPNPVSTKEIATRQQVSVKYLESVLATLRQAGLVRSLRGAGGGHVLGKPAQEITLRDVFEALEDSQAFVPCTYEPGVCERADLCVTREVWTEMYAASMAVLEEITLAELVRRARGKQSSLASMYYI